jgi:hypothetical protein
MAFKPNYNQRRVERWRAQLQKGEEKQQRREEKAAQRKVARDEAVSAGDDPGNTAVGETAVGDSEVGEIMARKKQPVENGFVLFDVTYEDGTRSSNRKVAVTELDALDADVSARTILETQDRKIAEMSGRPRGPIKAIARTATR